MGIITRMRKQRAVYWAMVIPLDTSGGPTWADPVEIPCRWDEENSSGIELGSGEILSYRATAYVDRDMAHGDYLMLGVLQSTTPSDPRQAASWQVQRFDKTPNLRATEFLRVAHCVPSHLKLKALKSVGIEAVTYRRVTTVVGDGGIVVPTETSISVPVAFHERYVNKDASGGKEGDRVSTTEAPWEIPRVYVTSPPTEQDYILDAQGKRWDILSWEEGTVRDAWWRVVARKVT